MSDQGSSSRFVHLGVDSNIVSGVAALLLDILLITIIKFQAQVLCSTANVYLVYDKRRAIFPTKSSLSSLAGGPVGPLQLARFLSVLIAIVTACVIALGFSINGKTVEVYEPVVFRSLVAINTSRPADIDYEREFERRESDIFISKRLAAMSDSYVCQRNDYVGTEIYAYAYNDTTLSYDMVNRSNKLTGAECVKAPVFNNSKVVRQYPLGPQVHPVRCSIDGIEPRFSGGQKNGTGEHTVNECDFDLGTFQCFREEHTACAAVGKRDEIGATYMYLIPDTIHPPEHEIVQIDGGLTRKQEDKLALNVAFLSTAGFTGGVANLANVAVTHVSYNQTLGRRMNDSQQVSEVDLKLAVPLLSVVMMITVVLSISSVYLWFMVVYSKGRSGYNKFSTVADMLELANGSVKKGAGRLRNAWKEHSFVGISRRSPNIVVVGPDEKGLCSDSTWAEEEVGTVFGMHGFDELSTLDGMENVD